MTSQVHTPESIKTLILKADKLSDMAVEKALLVLFDRQTTSEQISQTTNQNNGRGFNAVDAEILSSFACQIQRKQGQGMKLGSCLSTKQMVLARGKVARYARQLAEVANEKAALASPPKKEVEEVKVAPSVVYFLRVPGGSWKEVTEAQAKAWHNALKAEIARRGEKINLRSLEGAKLGETWYNYGFQVLTVGTPSDRWPEGGGVQTHVEEELKKAKEELALEESLKTVYYNGRRTVDIAREKVSTLEEEMWEMEARGDREGTLRDEKAKMEARTQMETQERHSLKTYAADPEARDFQVAKNKISDWLRK